jgi:hypothetical protein
MPTAAHLALRALLDVHVSSEVFHSCRGPVPVMQVYGIDLALVSNLVSNPVVNETIVKLSGTASQVNTCMDSVLVLPSMHCRCSLHHFKCRPPSRTRSVHPQVSCTRCS